MIASFHMGTKPDMEMPCLLQLRGGSHVSCTLVNITVILSSYNGDVPIYRRRTLILHVVPDASGSGLLFAPRFCVVCAFFAGTLLTGNIATGSTR